VLIGVYSTCIQKINNFWLVVCSPAYCLQEQIFVPQITRSFVYLYDFFFFCLVLHKMRANKLYPTILCLSFPLSVIGKLTVKVALSSSHGNWSSGMTKYKYYFLWGLFILYKAFNGFFYNLGPQTFIPNPMCYQHFVVWDCVPHWPG